MQYQTRQKQCLTLTSRGLIALPGLDRSFCRSGCTQEKSHLHLRCLGLQQEQQPQSQVQSCAMLSTHSCAAVLVIWQAL